MPVPMSAERQREYDQRTFGDAEPWRFCSNCQEGFYDPSEDRRWCPHCSRAGAISASIERRKWAT